MEERAHRRKGRARGQSKPRPPLRSYKAQEPALATESFLGDTRQSNSSLTTSALSPQSVLDFGVSPLSEAVSDFLLQVLGRSPFQQGLCIARMKLVSVALVFLGSLAFLGSEAAWLDGASETLKKWNKWAVSRGKRELPASSRNPTGLANAKARSALKAPAPQKLENPPARPQASGPGAVLTRVKRYRQSFRGFGCRFGTCTVQKLAHQIYQFTDKDKDGVAPRSKISPQGYGRRRRRSLPEAGQDRTLMSAELWAPAAAASKMHRVLAPLRRI